MKDLNKVGVDGEYLVGSETKKKLGEAAKKAADFSYIATGEGIKLRDNPAALAGVKKESRPFSFIATGEGRRLSDNPGALVNRVKTEQGRQFSYIAVPGGKGEMRDDLQVSNEGGKVGEETKASGTKDEPVETKKTEQKESMKNENAWEIRGEKGEARYEDGKLIYEDRECGKVWENGKEVSRGEKADEVKKPEIGWRAWSDDGHLRYRYEDKKMVYTDANGRTWVNGEERKKAEAGAKRTEEDEARTDEHVLGEGRTVVQEREQPKVFGGASEDGEKAGGVLGESGVSVPEGVSEETSGNEMKTTTTEAEVEPSTETKTLGARAENPAMRRLDKNSRKLEAAKRTEDIGEKVRLLSEIMEDMPWDGRLWNMANDMLRQIYEQEEGGASVEADEVEVEPEDALGSQEDDDGRDAAMESLEPEDDDLTRVIVAQSEGGGGAIERRQTIGERARNWVRRHPKITAAIAAGA
ncbi:MAG: hypothetical protein Q4F60_03470, partial [Candidatus Saccharibacteria bacterium]|nr:hypothetical protein [Candidatus Saccharibacteria bacterium]